MNDRPSSFSADIALIYLARHAEGAAAIARFIESYNRHPAGIPHDLVVIRKSFPPEKTDLDGLLASLHATAFTVNEEGFDITAYAEAATRLPHGRIAFLNTFSEIAADDWLLKLNTALDDATVGVAGATGSYESARTSMRRLKKGLFLTQRQLAPSLSRLRGPFQIVRRMLPKHFSRYLVNHLISRLMAPREQPGKAPFPESEFEAFWIKETTAERTYDYLKAIPEFPNPHLRTNGFIMNRQSFLDLNPQTIVSKTASYFFESGPDSLTAQIVRSGKRAIVVGRDGTRYDIDAWPESHTFRLGDQSNLLIHDNQTRAFATMDRTAKAAFTAMAWGDDPKATS